jgi:uncharacterized protein (DUF488 family)
MTAIYTIGHSTRSLEAFIEILKAHGVRALADVRRYPGSRRLPWFNAANLAEVLPQVGLAYHPFPALGGRRRPASDSPNSGWRSASFRGYADYMQTQEFTDALGLLITEARQTPTVIMCAEAVPWRCHRSLIADALLVRGWEVIDLFDARKASPHTLTPFAKVDGMNLTYPGEPASLYEQGGEQNM